MTAAPNATAQMARLVCSQQHGTLFASGARVKWGANLLGLLVSRCALGSAGATTE